MKTVARNTIGIPATLYRPLDKSGVGRIVKDALRILSESGMLVFSATAREALRKAGAVIDNTSFRCKLPRSLVEDAIESNPSSITLFSRDGRHDCVLEKNRVHYGTGGTALYVLDPDTGERRQSGLVDVALNARLTNVLENIHLFTINVFPNEIQEREHIDANRFFHALDNTTKHVMGGIYAMKGCQDVVKMAEIIAGGFEPLRTKPFVSFITLIISPFKIDDHYGEMTCFLAEKGLPVVVPTEPICGTTSPVTLAANVLTHVAETLGGITLVQCVNKGAPGICGSVGSITDLRTMNHVGGAIERAMINAAVAQIAQHLQLPLYSTAGTTDAKELDLQASYESAMSSLMVAMSGANYIHDIAGLMEADLTVSYEKLVADNEILGMCQRVLRGIEVSDETLATDLMIEKGPGSDYLAEEHTVRHMRGEFYMPKLSNRDKREVQQADDDALARARAFVAKIRHDRTKSCLPQDVRTSVLRKFPYLKAADA
jgi:trimethylamine--corrinoid protein Co-methyltransferase